MKKVEPIQSEWHHSFHENTSMVNAPLRRGLHHRSHSMPRKIFVLDPVDNDVKRRTRTTRTTTTRSKQK